MQRYVLIWLRMESIFWIFPYFNMMMIVDTNNAQKAFGDMADELDKLGEQIGVVIKCQKEEIFDKMHRI